MSSSRVLSLGAVVVGFLLGVLGAISPPTAHAAWVNGTQFQVGGALTPTIVPAVKAGTNFVDPTCSNQGGTSLALVQGQRLVGVNSALNPLVLVVSCLDSTSKSRLNFIGVDGFVVKQLNTSAVPNSGWVHLVHRPDKGDLLGCGANGAIYRIDYSRDTTTADGTATLLTSLPAAATSCKGLTWDAEADMIYLGLNVSGGANIGRVVRFKEGTSTLDKDLTSLPCLANGLAISGGVLLMSCVPPNPNNPLPTDTTMVRLNKETGVVLGAFGTGTVANPSFFPPAGLGDLACDPVTFSKDATTKKDLYTDALWSRRGTNGNGVVALEFPAFTCGMPSSGMPPSSVVIQNGVPFSPLAAGLSTGTASLPGAVPGACFDSNGRVIDSDGDGLPNCWENNGIDFDGDGTIDLTLCVDVNTNGDGGTLTTECADPNHKDLFGEIDYMQFHKPDPQALSQGQSVTTAGVKSIREAFAAAPVANPDGQDGIQIHFQVDEQLSHVDQIIFTPCTNPTGSDGKTTVEFDSLKAANFGTTAQRTGTPTVVQTTLNAKRLAFRYVVFGHDLAPLAGAAPGLGSSGCAELGGDDGVVTLGSFSTSVAGHTGGVGNTDEHAGTLMHEFGHLLGLRHGGDDAINCKPNYRSVMSYTRQFTGPILGRRLDYSRSEDPLLADPTKTGFLNEISLIEITLSGAPSLGTDPSRGPIPGRNPGDAPYFSSVDRIAFGPGTWKFAAADAASINWNNSQDKKGNPTLDPGPVSANLNDGSGCTNVLSEVLFGHDDWNNILYRASAAIEFAGGQDSQDITQPVAEAMFLATDNDGNLANDGTDCGGAVHPDGTTDFFCNHHIDIKPSFPIPKIIDPGTEANITVAIFSEQTGCPGPTCKVWDAPKQIILNDLAAHPLTFSVGSFTVLVKVNNQGGGTCSISDLVDPKTGKKDGVKDLRCQFPGGALADGTTLPTGTYFGVVSGFFFDPLTNPTIANPSACLSSPECKFTAFTARQEVTIVE